MSATAARAEALSAEALDFAPDLLAIQERAPERFPRVTAVVVSTFMILLLLWAVLAQRDLVAQAQGRLVPLTFTKVVQPAEAGVVTEILVRDGDKVSAGQALLRMDRRMSDADIAALEREVHAQRLTLAYIVAELTSQPVGALKDGSAELRAQVYAQHRARRNAFDDAISQEQAALRRATSELLAAEQVRSKLEQTLPAYRQSADAYKRLVAEGFVGELASVEKQREAIEREQDLRTQTASVEGLRAAVAQSERKLEAIRSQFRSQLENDRATGSAQLSRAEQELSKARVKHGLHELRAPTAGVVKDLAIASPGTVVAAGALLMNIVPVDELLQAEVLLQNEDVGFVAVGQPVKIKVAAYPFQKYGMLDGIIEMIGADSTDPRQTPAGQQPALTYRAIVRLDSKSRLGSASEAILPLSVGMLVLAEIHQGHQSVMEYLLSPIRRVTQEAARER